MESIMNEGNDWDHNIGGYVVESSVLCRQRLCGTSIKWNENLKGSWTFRSIIGVGCC